MSKNGRGRQNEERLRQSWRGIQGECGTEKRERGKEGRRRGGAGRVEGKDPCSSDWQYLSRKRAKFLSFAVPQAMSKSSLPHVTAETIVRAYTAGSRLPAGRFHSRQGSTQVRSTGSGQTAWLLHLLASLSEPRVPQLIMVYFIGLVVR